MTSPPEHPGGVPIRIPIAAEVSAITQSPRRGPRLRLGSDDRAVPRDDRRARQAPPATASNASMRYIWPSVFPTTVRNVTVLRGALARARVRGVLYVLLIPAFATAYYAFCPNASTRSASNATPAGAATQAIVDAASLAARRPPQAFRASLFPATTPARGGLVPDAQASPR